MSLNSIIKAQRSRNGRINGTTKNGRFWFASKPVITKSTGNGWDSPEITYELQLRYYENDMTEAVVQFQYKDRRNEQYVKSDYSMTSVLDCCTVEDVIVELKKGVKRTEYDDNGQLTNLTEKCYEDYSYSKLLRVLGELGVLESRPGPDENRL